MIVQVFFNTKVTKSWIIMTFFIEKVNFKINKRLCLFISPFCLYSLYSADIIHQIQQKAKTMGFVLKRDIQVFFDNVVQTIIVDI